MSLSVEAARDAPPTKIPISTASLVSHVLPALTCYTIAAFLAVTSRTRPVQVAFLPVVTLFALRAAVSVDLSLGHPERKPFNVNYVYFLLSMPVQVLSWTLAQKPLVRHLRPARHSQSAIFDALDLVTNMRGVGWDWSHGLYVPRETRPTTHRLVFASYALLSAVAHGLAGCTLQLSLQTFVTGARSSLHGFTIFDDGLPFLVRYGRSSIISILAVFVIYSGLQMMYGMSTVIGVLLLGQDPAQWPPPFDSPWCATSLTEFWGRRWHQWFRQTFLVCSYPFALLFGRAGTIVGVFLASGVCHHIMMTTLDSRSEMWQMVLPFGMMAAGILAERAFYQATGNRVGGYTGWVWTMTWLLFWGNLMTDGFTRPAMFATSSAISHWPTWTPLENTVIHFDAWLHTL